MVEEEEEVNEGGGVLHALLHQRRFFLITLQNPSRFLVLAVEWPAQQSFFFCQYCHPWMSLGKVPRFLSGTKVISLRVCVDSLWRQFKKFALFFFYPPPPPQRQCSPATVFVEVSGNSGVFEKSCSWLNEAYHFDIWVSRLSGIFLSCLKREKERNVGAQKPNAFSGEKKKKKGWDKWLEHSTEGDWKLFLFTSNNLSKDSSHTRLFTDCYIDLKEAFKWTFFFFLAITVPASSQCLN